MRVDNWIIHITDILEIIVGDKERVMGKSGCVFNSVVIFLRSSRMNSS